MTEYHCEFCGATGTELRNEKKGCCNNCGAPIGITKKEADKIYEDYYSGLPFMSTATTLYPHSSGTGKSILARLYREKIESEK